MKNIEVLPISFSATIKHSQQSFGQDLATSTTFITPSSIYSSNPIPHYRILSPTSIYSSCSPESGLERSPIILIAYSVPFSVFISIDFSEYFTLLTTSSFLKLSPPWLLGYFPLTFLVSLFLNLITVLFLQKHLKP